MTSLIERAKEALEAQDTFAVMAWSADFARALIAAEELAEAVSAWDAQEQTGYGYAEEHQHMMRALTAYREATGGQS